MPKFEKSDKLKKKQKAVEPVVFVPEDTVVNEDWIPLAPPTTEYESRRTSIGRDAYRQVTGK